jgi:hypothetical protein
LIIPYSVTQGNLRYDFGKLDMNLTLILSKDQNVNYARGIYFQFTNFWGEFLIFEADGSNIWENFVLEVSLKIKMNQIERPNFIIDKLPSSLIVEVVGGDNLSSFPIHYPPDAFKYMVSQISVISS